MKNILIFIIAVLIGKNVYSQKSSIQNNIANDYYLNFWKQNIDSFYYSIDNKVVPKFIPNISEYSEEYLDTLINKLDSKLPMRYNKRVSDILSFYIENSEETALALAYLKHLSVGFSKTLKNKSMPDILKNIPLALSAMNNMAIGKTGTAGLWQLNYSIARREGLDIDSYIDERKNIDMATIAAVNEFRRLFKLYNNWELAIGAYGCGPSNINKSIRRLYNERDYYKLYTSLPNFGRDIVPALTAAAIISNYHDDFGIKVPNINFQIMVDTLEVSQRLHFIQLHDILNISIDTLHILNAEYKHDIVPAINKVYKIIIPKGKLAKFNELEDSIYHYKDSLLFELKKTVILPPPSKGRYYAKYEPEVVPDGSKLFYYHIKSGDNLGYVASWYDVKISQIEDWNNIYDPRRIQIGKKLKVYVPEEKGNYYKNVDKMSFEKKQKRIGKNVSSNTNSSSKTKKEEPLGKNWFYHKVRSGESPYTIAKKYKGVSADDIMRWNNIKNARNIKVGQKLKIKKL